MDQQQWWLWGCRCVWIYVRRDEGVSVGSRILHDFTKTFDHGLTYRSSSMPTPSASMAGMLNSPVRCLVCVHMCVDRRHGRTEDKTVRIYICMSVYIVGTDNGLRRSV